MQPGIRNILLAATLYLVAASAAYADGLISNFLDQFDKRPPVSVLFLGNSRTFYNDMPTMVRKIADSAHSPKKYMITMYARPSLSLKGLWDDPAVQELLTHKWDYVVLQGGSSEQINDTMSSSFLTYGIKLANAAKANGATPVLMVAWRCSETYYPQLKDIYPQFYNMIQTSYYDLARSTGAPMVNVGRVWEKVQAASPEPLTVDGNHPTVRASYLIALMFYHYFSGDDLSAVTYAPSGVTAEDAELLKSAALH